MLPGRGRKGGYQVQQRLAASAPNCAVLRSGARRGAVPDAKDWVRGAWVCPRMVGRQEVWMVRGITLGVNPRD